MNKIEVTKYVCFTTHDANDSILTIGKIYDIIREISICSVTNIALSYSYFIGDDGKSYLIHSDEQIGMNFISLDVYRQKQIDRLL
jgi:hypothetical protein